MIKAIITDVDGVIVGKRKGVNFPLPNDLIIQKLKELSRKGIPIILCTAKFGYAIHGIIRKAELKNPHITDGGALIIDLLANKIIAKHVIDKPLAENLVSNFLEENIYLELYGTEEYFLQKSQASDFTKRRSDVLQKQPTIINSMLNQIPKTNIIKFIAFAKNEEDKARIDVVLNKFRDKINFIWSMHPALLPYKPGIITVKGISKRKASLEVLDNLKISPNETLGIGDTLSDWNFMEMCKYAGTVGDESDELKELAKSKGEGNYFPSSSVDENGFLDILNYFKL